MQGLVKRYHGVEVLRGISFDVRCGEFVGYLGPNGAGKSTTIKIMLGLVRADVGYVEILGHAVPNELNLVRSRIGYVQQMLTVLEQSATVEKCLDLYGFLWGLSRSERRRRITSLLRELGLEGVSRRVIQSLSPGYCRLLQIALELLHEPDLLILDEPTTGLDPAIRRRLLTYLAK